MRSDVSHDFPPEPDWHCDESRLVADPASHGIGPEENEPTEYRMRGLLYMIAAGMIAYAACSTFSNFADSIASALAGRDLTDRQAHAISDAIVLGSISAVAITFVLMWSYRTFKGGFRRFFIDNEVWLERFAEGGKPHGRVHASHR